MSNATQGELSFYINAGAAVRGQARREIRRACFDLGLDCHVEEDKGFFSSTLYFTITGDGDKLAVLGRAVQEWLT